MINLTQHKRTICQKNDGLVDIADIDTLKGLLTFSSIPDYNFIRERARLIALAAKGHESAMIGGAPFLMSALEIELKKSGIRVFYSFSERVSIEETKSSGEVVKRAIFKHKGFIEL